MTGRRPAEANPRFAGPAKEKHHDHSRDRHLPRTSRRARSTRRTGWWLEGRSVAFDGSVHCAAGRPIHTGAAAADGPGDRYPIDRGSTAQLIAMTDAVSTGNRVIDRLLNGSAFLDSGVFPEISFQSEILVCVPIDWRAVGQLEVKGIQYPMVAELDVDLRHARSGAAAMILTTRWFSTRLGSRRNECPR
jgi:hypothetical protein